MDSISKNRSGQEVEFGPRSMALLRRMVTALEVLADGKIADPGKGSESNENAEAGTDS